VRAEAARAAGMLRIHDAWQPLVKLLSDVDARVRFQAVRSLQRLDAVDAAALPEVDALRHDVDLKVQRAATEMGH
jgi:HEAT repeat protein